MGVYGSILAVVGSIRYSITVFVLYSVVAVSHLWHARTSDDRRSGRDEA